MTNRIPLESEGLIANTVTESENENEKHSLYISSENSLASVVAPFESMDNSLKCSSIVGVPRLFLGFPLIGTENFSFPAVINSLGFAPTEERDGVYLWQSDNLENIQNQKILQESCELLVNLMRYVSIKATHHSYKLAHIPDIHEQNWLNQNRFCEFLKDSLIEYIRDVPVVINESDRRISPRIAVIPLADTDEGIDEIWQLLSNCKSIEEKLPRRNEATGWSSAVASWAKLLSIETTSYTEVKTGQQIAYDVHTNSHVPSAKPTTHSVRRLQETLLKEEVCPIE